MTWLTPVGRVLQMMVAVGVCCAAVSGCGAVDDGPGDSGASASGGGVPTGVVQMSGGYEVDGQGRLVQPERSWPELVVDPVMQEESVAGVEAFARYFVAVAERAWNTGDTTELERISSQECSLCSNMISSIGDRYTAGGWVDGLDYGVKSVSAPTAHPQDSRKYSVTLRFTTNALASYDGSSVSPVSDVREVLELHTCWTGQAWVACGAIGSPDGT